MIDPEARIHPEAKKALQFWHYKIGDCLRKDKFTPKDFWEMLVAGLAPLLRAMPELIVDFLKWLGKWCELPEIQEEAQKRSRWGAWGLRQFAKVVRKI